MAASPEASRGEAAASPTADRVPATLVPLRLLFVGNVDSVHVQRWAGFFAERGHDVHVAALWQPVAGDANHPFRVHRLGRPQTAFIRLARLASRLKAQVVHAHYLTYYGWMAWAALTRPYAVTLWGSDVLLDLPASRFRRAWARIVLSGAACVTADSPIILDAAVQLGARRSRAHEIQFGVETERFRPGPRPERLIAELGLSGRRVVFAPRSIAPIYQTLTVIEAVRRLPSDVVVLGSLSGADPAYLELVQAAVARAGMTDRVHWLPPIAHADIDAVYRAADVVVSIPTTDGTPVSVLEALATGVPVVATDLPAVRPWLEGVEPELLVPVDDANATAAAIRHALDVPATQRRAAAHRGRAIVMERADRTREMLRMEAIYLEMARP